jgi:simple sugar transport system permease protein
MSTASTTVQTRSPVWANLGRALTRNEAIIAIILVVFSVVAALINPAFFSVEHMFNVLRSSIVIGIFAMGTLIVLVSGGVDVSFTAIAVFAMYSSVQVMLATGIDNMLFAFVLSALIGLGLGLINAALISFFKLPTLIVTLGTLWAYRGFLLEYIGQKLVTDIPSSMTDFWRANLITAETSRGTLTSLHSSILILAAVALITWLILKYTMLGRGIYALGGAPEAAERAGFNIRRIYFFIFGFVGVLSGIGGIIWASLARVADPNTMVGYELTVIAAAVLGGASITGGRGTVIGTLLGVLLLQTINNSLILLHIEPYWQQAVVGLIIILGTGIPAWQQKRARRQVGTNT